MNGVGPAFGYSTDQIGLDALGSGEFHLGYAAIGVVLVGLLLLSVSLVLGIVLIVLGVGIFVDCWSHGWFH